jgi:hypothetical protein
MSKYAESSKRVQIVMWLFYESRLENLDEDFYMRLITEDPEFLKNKKESDEWKPECECGCICNAPFDYNSVRFFHEYNPIGVSYPISDKDWEYIEPDWIHFLLKEKSSNSHFYKRMKGRPWFKEELQKYNI